MIYIDSDLIPEGFLAIKEGNIIHLYSDGINICCNMTEMTWHDFEQYCMKLQRNIDKNKNYGQ